MRFLTAASPDEIIRLSHFTLPGSLRGACSLSLSVPPHTPGVTMDRRVKPGGDAVGSLWSILRVEFESPDRWGAPQDGPETHTALHRGISVPLSQLL
jgi:hypothetical protein